MSKFVKIGAEIISLNAISNVSIVENQSGISDRIIIYVGDTSVTVDSAIGGRARMDRIRDKLMLTLDPEDWDSAYDGGKPADLPPFQHRAA